MQQSDTAGSTMLARLRHSIEVDILRAEALELPLVVIWLEHARYELGPYPDAEGGNRAG